MSAFGAEHSHQIEASPGASNDISIQETKGREFVSGPIG
jgi:hypothetical protein